MGDLLIFYCSVLPFCWKHQQVFLPTISPSFNRTRKKKNRKNPRRTEQQRLNRHLNHVCSGTLCLLLLPRLGKEERCLHLNLDTSIQTPSFCQYVVSCNSVYWQVVYMSIINIMSIINVIECSQRVVGFFLMEANTK